MSSEINRSIHRNGCLGQECYTLPISSTFPRELQLSALGIRLKVSL